jgi:NAD(P)H-flavin reductase
MLRHRVAVGNQTPARLLYSARTIDDVIFREELEALAGSDGIEVSLTLTRERPEGWAGYARRVDASILAEVSWSPEASSRIYVCGPTGFVELVANTLV